LHITKTTARIPAKFCTVIKTTKRSSWVVQTGVKHIKDADGRHLEKSKIGRVSTAG